MLVHNNIIANLNNHSACNPVKSGNNRVSQNGALSAISFQSLAKNTSDKCSFGYYVHVSGIPISYDETITKNNKEGSEYSCIDGLTDAQRSWEDFKIDLERRRKKLKKNNISETSTILKKEDYNIKSDGFILYDAYTGHPHKIKVIVSDNEFNNYIPLMRDVISQNYQDCAKKIFALSELGYYFNIAPVSNSNEMALLLNYKSMTVRPCVTFDRFGDERSIKNTIAEFFKSVTIDTTPISFNEVSSSINDIIKSSDDLRNKLKELAQQGYQFNLDAATGFKIADDKCEMLDFSIKKGTEKDSFIITNYTLEKPDTLKEWLFTILNTIETPANHKLNITLGKTSERPDLKGSMATNGVNYRNEYNKEEMKKILNGEQTSQLVNLISETTSFLNDKNMKLNISIKRSNEPLSQNTDPQLCIDYYLDNSTKSITNIYNGYLKSFLNEMTSKSSGSESRHPFIDESLIPLNVKEDFNMGIGSIKENLNDFIGRYLDSNSNFTITNSDIENIDNLTKGLSDNDIEKLASFLTSLELHTSINSPIKLKVKFESDFVFNKGAGNMHFIPRMSILDITKTGQENIIYSNSIYNFLNNLMPLQEEPPKPKETLTDKFLKKIHLKKDEPVKEITQDQLTEEFISYFREKYLEPCRLANEEEQTKDQKLDELDALFQSPKGETIKEEEKEVAYASAAQ